MPWTSPDGVRTVITVTPELKRPKVARKSSGVIESEPFIPLVIAGTMRSSLAKHGAASPSPTIPDIWTKTVSLTAPVC